MRGGIEAGLAELLEIGLGTEVIEGGESADDGRESRGNLGIVGIGVVGLAVHDVLVNLGVEGIAHLSHAAGELESALAGIDLRDDEAVAAEPGFDGGDVLIGGSELRAELVRGEPLVVVGRAGRVDLRDELAECGLLVRAALEGELDAVKPHAVGRGAAVVGGVGEGMDGVGERDQPGFVDGVQDADGGCDVLCQGYGGAEEDTCNCAQGERARIGHRGWSWTLSCERPSESRRVALGGEKELPRGQKKSSKRRICRNEAAERDDNSIIKGRPRENRDQEDAHGGIRRAHADKNARMSRERLGGARRFQEDCTNCYSSTCDGASLFTRRAFETG